MQRLKFCILIFFYVLNSACPEEVPTCEPLQPPENVDLHCRHSNQTNSCKERQIIGTIATYKCKPFYIPSNSRLSSRGDLRLELTCRKNGTWASIEEFESFTCSEDCGKRLVNPNPLIVHGVASNRTVWPWHATIYKRHGPRYDFICGGTLIRRGVILTAAHCVATDDERPLPLDADQFKVVVGAVSVDIDENMRAEGAQGFQVRKIYITDHYDAKKDFQADIAILHLAGTMRFSDSALPVCLPNDLAIDVNAVKPGKFGDIVGFGYDETGHKSQILKHAHLEIMSHPECYHSLKQRLAESQYCAGNRDGDSNNFTTVCNGDSGGGFVYPSAVHRKYHIHGIVSTGGTKKGRVCQNYGVFTRVFSYLPWIRDVLELISGNVIRELAANFKFPFVLQGSVRPDGEIDRFRFVGIPRDWDLRILTVEFYNVDLDPDLLLKNLEYNEKTIEVLNLTQVKLDTLDIDKRVRLPFLETFILDVVKDDLEVKPGHQYPETITKEYLKSLLFFEKDFDEHQVTWSMKHLTRLGTNIELTIGIFKLVTVRRDEQRIALSQIPFYHEILEHVPVNDFKLKHLALNQGYDFVVETLLKFAPTLEHLIISKMQLKSEEHAYEGLDLSAVLSKLKNLTELRIVTPTAFEFGAGPSVALDQLPLSLKQLTFAGTEVSLYLTRLAPKSEKDPLPRKQRQRFHFPNLETFICDSCGMDDKIRQNFHWVFKNVRKLVMKTPRMAFNIRRLVDRMENLEFIHISERDVDDFSREKLNKTKFYGLTEFEGYNKIREGVDSFILERLTHSVRNTTGTRWTIRPASPEEEREEEFLEHGLSNFWTSAQEYEVLSRLTPNEFKAKHTGVYKFNGSTANPDEFQPIRTIPKLLQPYLKSIEMSFAQVIPEVMQFSIRHCVNLESLTLNNVKVLGLFDNRLVELPKLKHYRLTRKMFSSHLSQQPAEYMKDLDQIQYVANFPFEEFEHDPETGDRGQFLHYDSNIFQSVHLRTVFMDYSGCVIINLDRDAGFLTSALSFTWWMLEDLVKYTDNDPPLTKLSLRGQKLNNITTFIPETVAHLNLDYNSFSGHDEITELLTSGNLTDLKDLRMAHNYILRYSELLRLDLADFEELAGTIEFLELNHVNLTRSDSGKGGGFVFGDQLKFVHLEACSSTEKSILKNFTKIFPSKNLMLVGKSTDDSAEWIEDILLSIWDDAKAKTDWIYVEQSSFEWKHGRVRSTLNRIGVPPFDKFVIVRKGGNNWSWFNPGHRFDEEAIAQVLESKLRTLSGKLTAEAEFGRRTTGAEVGKSGCEPQIEFYLFVSGLSF